MAEPKITKTHRWTPEMVEQVEAIARETGVSRQAVWDRCVEIGLQARPFQTPWYNAMPVWSVVIEFPARPQPLQTTQIHGPFDETTAWETAERLAREYGVPVQQRDIRMETCVWVCAMRPAPMDEGSKDEEVATVTQIWQAYLGAMLMGEGPTEEAAIEAAVREYEETSGTESGYAEDERDVHLFRSRDELVARLDVSLKSAED